jgi:hypothetical protein
MDAIAWSEIIEQKRVAFATLKFYLTTLRTPCRFLPLDGSTK